MERHQRRLYRIALAYLRNPDDALDVVQETFVKAFRARRALGRHADVGPWLSRIAVNHSIDRYRRDKRRRATYEPLEEGDHDERTRRRAPSPERRPSPARPRRADRAALRGLPERQRAVFVLRHYDEMSLEEIASTLGLPSAR